MNPMTDKKTVKMAPLTRTLFDLDSMSDVTLVKPVPDFEPVSTPQEAMARLGNDSVKLLQVINDGLMGHLRDSVKDDPNIPWNTEDEETGELTLFTGTPADSKAVNGLVLNLAKSVFGYTKDSTPVEKKAAKEAAMEMVKSTPKIVEGLKKNAAL